MATAQKLVKRLSTTILCLVLVPINLVSAADNFPPIQIAVASNFYGTLKDISQGFTEKTGIKVRLSSGATGMLFAQIERGAPYDMFFSADAKRPKLLEKKRLIEPKSRFSYVRGKLVIWSALPNVSTDLSQLKLNSWPEGLRFLAIAHPKTAPYGAAAKQVLQHYGLYDALLQEGKLVQGSNIGKAYHFMASGSAQLGLIAKSYLTNNTDIVPGSVLDVDETLYDPIWQQAVILKHRNSPSIQRFLKYFKSDEVQQQLQAAGYNLIGKAP